MRQTRKSSLFLMELIIAILFFSLSAAVCVRLFSASYLTSQESTYRDTAILQAQSMAELFRNADGDLGDLLAYADASEIADGVYGGSVTQNGETYPVTLQVSESETMPALTIEIAVPGAADGTDAVVTLETKIYLPLQVGEVA